MEHAEVPAHSKKTTQEGSASNMHNIDAVEQGYLD
jgi:hypothetical protein